MGSRIFKSISIGGRALARWILRAFAALVTGVALAVLLILLLEGGLRGVGYGYCTRPLIEKRFDGEGISLLNREFFNQFSAWPLSKETWDWTEFEVSRKKPSKALRVFILGSSAVAGWPTPLYGPARVFEVLLRQRYPGVNMQVYSASVAAMNSNVLREVAVACANLQPDLFVVYLGGGEVVGPYGLITNGQANAGLPSLSAIRTQLYLSNFRLYQIARSIAKRWKKPSLAPPPLTPNDPRFSEVNAHFRANLDSICSEAKRAGAGVLLCTEPCNLRDWEPQDSTHRRNLSEAQTKQWEDAFAEGQALMERGEWLQAEAAFKRAASIDDTYAELEFRLGTCLLKNERRDEARRCLERARELDSFTWPRNRQAEIDATREVAAKHRDERVALADVEERLAERSPDGIPGCEFFIDACHPSFQGSYEAACAMADAADRVMPQWAAAQSGTPPVRFAVDDCAKRLGFDPARVRGTLEDMANFYTNLGRKNADRMRGCIAQLPSASDRSSVDILREAVLLSPWDFCCQARLVEEVRLATGGSGGRKEAESLFKRFPRRRLSCRMMAASLVEASADQQAREVVDRLVGLCPDDYDAYLLLAQLYDRAGSVRKALTAYRKACAVERVSNIPRMRMGAFLEAHGRREEAMVDYFEAVVFDPGLPAPFDAVDEILKKGDPQERVDRWRRFIRDHPTITRAHRYLGRALDAVDDLSGAREAYSAAIKGDPRLRDEIVKELRNSAKTFETAGGQDKADARRQLADEMK